MITKENGLRFAKLIHVSVDNGSTSNSNKVYIMEELADGRIKCEYGRVGNSLTTEYKDKNKWDSVLKQKLSKTKGYTDVTDLIAEPVTVTSTPTKGTTLISVISDSVVKELIQRLSDFANKTIKENYKVTQDAVSEQQVNAAQEVLTLVTQTVAIGVKKKVLDDLLLKLYTIIPRQMRDVKSYLLYDITNATELDKALTFLNKEQATLDTMAGQVELIKKQRELDKKAEGTTEGITEVTTSYTILDQMGIEVEHVTDNKVIEAVKKQLEGHARKLHKVYAVVNKKSQPRFDERLKNAKNKLVELLFHGSRCANWFNILQTGLLIRPSGAGYNGSMWDDGIYFANDADKSMGYTDGGRWVGGASSYTYLGLFQAHLGNQLHAHQHNSDSYKISKRVKAEGYDSVYAHKGASLRKDELIIYDASQCTIKYLVELKN